MPARFVQDVKFNSGLASALDLCCKLSRARFRFHGNLQFLLSLLCAHWPFRFIRLFVVRIPVPLLFLLLVLFVFPIPLLLRLLRVLLLVLPLLLLLFLLFLLLLLRLPTYLIVLILLPHENLAISRLRLLRLLAVLIPILLLLFILLLFFLFLFLPLLLVRRFLFSFHALPQHCLRASLPRGGGILLSVGHLLRVLPELPDCGFLLLHLFRLLCRWLHLRLPLLLATIALVCVRPLLLLLGRQGE
mmetsp:Transcript_103503/g.231175  ORF Transcript_103503/g.231175 Transcript_103503/m.231175 type:complete len:245 (-) Transcript_103503:307-1041(-)